MIVNLTSRHVDVVTAREFVIENVMKKNLSRHLVRALKRNTNLDAFTIYRNRNSYAL